MMYHEVQRLAFDSVLIWPALLIVALAIGGWFVIPPSFKILFYTSLSLPVILFLAIFYAFRIETTATSKYVAIDIGLFGNESISLAEVSKIEEIQYDPIRDFGGWGVRGGLGGKIYSASGDRAVKITLKSNRIIYIGTQHPKELAAAITLARGPKL